MLGRSRYEEEYELLDSTSESVIGDIIQANSIIEYIDQNGAPVNTRFADLNLQILDW